MPNPYTQKDARKETKATQKETSEAWHQAREDAQKAGQLPERKEHKEEKEKKQGGS